MASTWLWKNKKQINTNNDNSFTGLLQCHAGTNLGALIPVKGFLDITSYNDILDTSVT